MRGCWVWGPMLATLGCHIGGRVDRFAPATRPEGVAVALELRGGGRAQGELLAVQDTALVVLAQDTVTLVPYVVLETGQFSQVEAELRGTPPDPRYADVDFVRSVDELLGRSVDLVVIATPNTSHHPIAKQCLLAGRHVVIDKPFAPTLAEAQDLVELATKQQRVLSVYQNRRYVGDFVTLQRLLSEGALGRIVAYESHFDRFPPELKPGAWRERPEPGAGVWFDLGPHLLHQAL